MAVIREKRQFGIGPIGVARVSDSGSMVADAVVQGANQISSSLFKKAAAKAEQAGKDAALSVDRADTITLNPITNEPEAFTPPEGFGGIATEAYQRVITARFQENIGEEIQNKGKELAARFDGMPNGVSLYQNALSEYLAAMNKASEGPFRGYIKEVGDSYLASTRASMVARQITRERAAISKASKATQKKANDNTRALVAINGLSSPTKETEAYDPVRAIIGSTAAAIADGKGAGLQNWNPKSLTIDNLFSVAQGALEFDLKKGATSDELKTLKAAIGIKRYDLIPKKFSTIREAIGGLVASQASYKVLDDYEKFADGILPEAIEFITDFEEKQLATAKADIANRAFHTSQTQSGLELNAFRDGREYDPATVVTLAGNDWVNQTNKALQYNNPDEEPLRDAIIKNRDAVLEARAEGLHVQALAGLTQKESDSLLLAIQNENPNLAPESSRPALEALFLLRARTNVPSIKDNFESAVKSYREGGAKAVSSIRHQMAIDEAEKIPFNSVATAPIELVSDLITSYSAELIQIAGLTDESRKAYSETLFKNGSINYVNSFFSENTNLTLNQINEANGLLNSPDRERNFLTERQFNLIREARRLAVISSGGDVVAGVRGIMSTFNDQSEVAKNIIAGREKAFSLLELKVSMGLGTAPDSEEVRNLFDDQIASKHFNGTSLVGLWSTRASLEEPKILSALTDIKNSYYFPTSLQNVFIAAGSGNFNGDINAVVSHYKNLSTRSYKGKQVESVAMRRFREGSKTKDYAATLDYMSDVTELMGNIDQSTLIDIYNQKRDFDKLTPEQKKGRILTSLDGDTVEQFLNKFESLNTAPVSARNAMKSLTLSLIAQNQSVSNISNRIEKQMDITYPSGDGKVRNSFGGDRVRHNISYAAPNNEETFEQHVVDKIGALTDLTSFSFGTALGINRKFIVDKGKVKRGILPADKIVYLEPINVSSETDEVQFIVKEDRPFEEGGPIVINTMIGEFREGETVTYLAPIIISNRDIEYLNVIEEAQSVREAQQIAAGQKAEETYGVGKTVIRSAGNPSVEAASKGTIFEGLGGIIADTFKEAVVGSEVYQAHVKGKKQVIPKKVKPKKNRTKERAQKIKELTDRK